MARESKLLWIGPRPIPANVLRGIGKDWDLVDLRADEPLASQLNSAAVVVACPNGNSEEARGFASLLRELDRSSTVGVFLLSDDAVVPRKILSQRRGQFLCLPRDAPAEELAATISAAARLQPAFGSLREELASARRIPTGPVRIFDELDEEMRLAARLQRDFLPRRLPEVGPVRFGVLYHPAGWLSGDIYDIARLDETHLGFYVVDVVGHGMPAALLTMFIKKALQTKRIVGKSYEIVPPHVSLAELNTDICEQNLGSCQFCTAVYCVLDLPTLTLTYSRAGHPEPVLCHADGAVEKLSAPGSLLGIFPDETFESREVQLRQGDRLVLYTDGADECLGLGPDGKDGFGEAIVDSAGKSREEMLLQMAARLDARDEQVPDDITVLAMDVAGSTAP